MVPRNNDKPVAEQLAACCSASWPWHSITCRMARNEFAMATARTELQSWPSVHVITASHAGSPWHSWAALQMASSALPWPGAACPFSVLPLEVALLGGIRRRGGMRAVHLAISCLKRCQCACETHMFPAAHPHGGGRRLLWVGGGKDTLGFIPFVSCLPHSGLLLQPSGLEG